MVATPYVFSVACRRDSSPPQLNGIRNIFAHRIFFVLICKAIHECYVCMNNMHINKHIPYMNMQSHAWMLYSDRYTPSLAVQRECNNLIHNALESSTGQTEPKRNMTSLDAQTAPTGTKHTQKCQSITLFLAGHTSSVITQFAQMLQRLVGRSGLTHRVACC